MSVRDYYRSRKLLVIGDDFFTEGGAWRSVYYYARQAESKGEPLHLLDLRAPRAFRQFVAAGWYAPKILVNGLGSFRHLMVVVLCVLRPNIFVYLHETEYMLRDFASNWPWRFRLVRWVLRRNVILCVSRQAEELYRGTYGARRTRVIYECPGPAAPKAFAERRRHVLMVGSINERKGVGLFSAVADMASTRHPDWQFHWVGGLATRDPIARSHNVLWHGWQSHPRELVARADVFFLSSIDDPCPLAVLEALTLGRRCVVYRRTGVAELIRDVRGCRVFDDYLPEACLAALAQSLADEPDRAKMSELIDENIALMAFSRRLDAVLASRSDVLGETL